ncbi:hypothetical protein TPB0596_32520 [Tsukamurella pulmonis]|nr:hypothetical protein TPB0596_32520 [Tsukamurella pulmonis]
MSVAEESATADIRAYGSYSSSHRPVDQLVNRSRDSHRGKPILRRKLAPDLIPRHHHVRFWGEWAWIGREDPSSSAPFENGVTVEIP